MTAPVTLDALLSRDPLAAVQVAIVGQVKRLLSGVSVVAHPGKVDISELIAKTVTTAPGVGIGWTRIRRAGLAGGSINLTVEWVAYIVAEAKVLNGKRVEKEQIGFAIGARLLAILSDQLTPLWGLSSVMPPEETPAPELKPLFTVRDAAQGVAYYTVTWTQVCADFGVAFPVAASAFQGEPGSEPDWQAISAVLGKSDA